VPEPVARHPDVRSVVAGATHPEVVRVSGEACRARLTALAHDLGSVGGRFIDALTTEPEPAGVTRDTIRCQRYPRGVGYPIER
jgi:hypothetical protein